MNAIVARHRTAMTRSALSRPMAIAITDGILDSSTSLFDYGCGRGDDLRNLAALGFRVQGWDPTHRPDSQRLPADVVNLGYVVNVIERADERAATLRMAWDLAKRVLVVSSRLTWDARDLVGQAMGDGLLTRTGTFQKFYEQAELSGWIEATLGVKPMAAAPGIFYVFRDIAAGQQFLATRVYSYRPRVTIDPHATYDAHRSTLAPLLAFLSDHARPPRSEELPTDQLAELQDVFGSVGRAVRLIRQVTDDKHWDRVAVQRRAELLIYIALSRFGRRPRFSQLGITLAADIRALFGKYQSACVQADRLLLACGDPALVFVSARGSTVGKQTPTALYVHRTALGELPPVLQVYEGCARVLSGTVEGANLIKLSVAQQQVSYLSYPRFDRDAHPTLSAAVTVNLKKLTVDRRDYSRSENLPLLHRKEEFISREDPRCSLYAKLTAAEMRAGLYEHPERIGTLHGWQTTLADAGLHVQGHRLSRSSRS
jgi:DNA phosphorothioation-associated putative methyltransferase